MICALPLAERCLGFSARRRHDPPRPISRRHANDVTDDLSIARQVRQYERQRAQALPLHVRCVGYVVQSEALIRHRKPVGERDCGIREGTARALDRRSKDRHRGDSRAIDADRIQ